MREERGAVDCRISSWRSSSLQRRVEFGLEETLGRLQLALLKPTQSLLSNDGFFLSFHIFKLCLGVDKAR